MNAGDTTKLPPVSFSRLAAFATVLALGLVLLVLAKPILLPLCFGAIFALTLRPLLDFIERYVPYPILAISITFILAVLPVAIAILFFSFQTIAVIDDLPTITEEFQESINRIVISISDNVGMPIRGNGYEWVQDQLGDAMDEPFVYISTILAGGANVIGTLLLSTLYAFLLLLYRRPIYHFTLGQFALDQRARMVVIFADSQRMSYKYLSGLGIVMIILGLLNSAGLILIGIEYAFFWGFLAAFLAVIPYLGTFLGGLLPFMYALSTTTTTWQPIAVVALFTIVQTIEGNVITPKVVGSSIQINPLAAILALFVGGFIWGIEGLVLALPLVAILRVVMIHSERFRPFGLLMSDDLVEREQEFLSLLDEPHYRLINLFRTLPREIISVRASYEAETTSYEEDPDEDEMSPSVTAVLTPDETQTEHREVDLEIVITQPDVDRKE